MAWLHHSHFDVRPPHVMGARRQKLGVDRFGERHFHRSGDLDIRQPACDQIAPRFARQFSELTIGISAKTDRLRSASACL